MNITSSCYDMTSFTQDAVCEVFEELTGLSSEQTSYTIRFSKVATRYSVGCVVSSFRP